MKDLFVLDSGKSSIGDMPKLEMMAKDSLGGGPRKCLADISNLPQRPKPPTVDDKSRLSSTSVKDYIEQLQKENATLVKLLADRNKLIELSGQELQKLRINLQKMQQQNLQLAQSHSLMLAELNSGKDRLKALQHELGCRNGLLIAKKQELEMHAPAKTRQKIGSKENTLKCEEAAVCTLADQTNDKQCNNGGRQKSKSLCPSTRKKVQDTNDTDNKRLPVRRQSARFRHEEPKPAEDSFEIDSTEPPPCSFLGDKMAEDDSDSVISSSVNKDDSEGVCSAPSVQFQDKDEGKNKRTHDRRRSARFKCEEPKSTGSLFETDAAELPPCLVDEKMQDADSVPMLLSVKKEDSEVDSLADSKAAEHRRLSTSRPSRDAVKKVQSYKEIPLNVKMRRTE